MPVAFALLSAARVGKRRQTPPNLGSARGPIHFGGGHYAYRRNGSWYYRNAETVALVGPRFLRATNKELRQELDRRARQLSFPAHECIDRPDLPCPACDRPQRKAC